MEVGEVVWFIPDPVDNVRRDFDALDGEESH